LQGEQLTALSSPDADLRDRANISRIVSDSRPDWIILSAAHTDVDGCEADPEHALAVNCEGAVHVAQAARQAQARLLFLSTDYVFDGAKTTPYEIADPRNPINVYGQTKARAELRLLDILPDVCIVRTSWLFGHGGKCFPATILRLAASRSNPAAAETAGAPRLSVVNDQRGSPTFTRDLAAAIIDLCRKRASGIVHATNTGDCTWYEFAKEIGRQAGLSAEIKPVTTADFPRPARRPTYSVLSPASLHAHGIRMPGWQDALRRYLANRTS
jgi:dTDP-4-dehydrorhamnose reductase